MDAEITNEMRTAVVQELCSWAKEYMPLREAIPFIGALVWALSEVSDNECAEIGGRSTQNTQ